MKSAVASRKGLEDHCNQEFPSVGAQGVCVCVGGGGVPVTCCKHDEGDPPGGGASEVPQPPETPRGCGRPVPPLVPVDT